MALCFLEGRSDPHLTHWEGATFKQPWMHPKYAAFHVGIGLSYRISPWYQCYTPSFPREGMQLVLEAKFAVCEVPSYLLKFCLLREIDLSWSNKSYSRKNPHVELGCNAILFSTTDVQFSDCNLQAFCMRFCVEHSFVNKLVYVSGISVLQFSSEYLFLEYWTHYLSSIYQLYVTGKRVLINDTCQIRCNCHLKQSSSV